MTSKTAAAIAIGVALAASGFVFGRWIEKPTIDDLIERNRQLSAMDTLKTVQLDSARVAYSVLVDDFRDAKDTWLFVEDSLNGVSNALRVKVRDQGNEITSLTQANARLQAELDGYLDGINIGADSTTADLFFRKLYQDGSIQAKGDITIFTPPEAAPRGKASLHFDIQMQPSVIMSRDEAGLATCDMSFGDMPVYLTDLVCVDNLGYDVPVRKSINWPTVGITAGIVGAGLIILSLVLWAT